MGLRTLKAALRGRSPFKALKDRTRNLFHPLQTTPLADINGLESSSSEPIPRDKGKGKAGLASAVTGSESEPDDNLGPSLEDGDPTLTVLSQILEIMPNVDPMHVLGLIQTYMPTPSHGYGGGEDTAVERDGEGTVEQVARFVLTLLCEDLKVDLQYEKKEDKWPVEEDEEDSREDAIECQCCFVEYPFSKIAQCPEAHFFCSTCISTYAVTQLGNSNSFLTCIHYSSCSLPFPLSELKRVLPVELCEQLGQIMQTGLMGFEMCPFCEWTCLLEASSEEDELFVCGNEAGGCGVVSCRGCQKLDHLPKSCKEVEEENELSTLLQHTAIDDEPIVTGRSPTPTPDPDPHPQTPTETNSPDSASIPDFDSTPIEDMDRASIARDRILGVIPNVEPAYLLELIETHIPTFSIFHGDLDRGEEEAARDGEEERKATAEEQIQGVVLHVLRLLFEHPNYPRVDPQNRKGKRKRTVEGEEDEAKEIAPNDSVVKDRPFAGGSNYFDLALYHLQTSFPHIPKSYLCRQLQIHANIYTPTYLSILADEEAFEEENQERPYTIQFSGPRLRKPQGDVAFEEEKAWLDGALAGGAVADAVMDDYREGKIVDYAVMDNVDDEEDDGEDDGTSIECQCCFADYPFSQMVQCPEAHLFCSTCISTYAATRLGVHNSSLTCIHPSSCSLSFSPSELQRILPVKLYELYERLDQQKQIMQAGLEGLEECPFCEWKCVFDMSIEEQELFLCENEAECGAVSCRKCRKLVGVIFFP
ncbi:hypothetical protein BYT27DRAFT_6378489 [Phlegmacium glaucopus]|nr:hypothetical protein BYT27DRAFT_6378489 [Phlegmacium glaucopus]